MAKYHLAIWPTILKWPNGNLATVLLPICHSAIQTQTQTQTEAEAYKMHTELFRNSSTQIKQLKSDSKYLWFYLRWRYIRQNVSGRRK